MKQFIQYSNIRSSVNERVQHRSIFIYFFVITKCPPRRSYITRGQTNVRNPHSRNDELGGILHKSENCNLGIINIVTGTTDHQNNKLNRCVGSVVSDLDSPKSFRSLLFNSFYFGISFLSKLG